MIPGKEKKMYYVKDTRSRLFCEAYFILRDGADMNRVCEGDLAAEADRLLREKFPEGRWRRRLAKGEFKWLIRGIMAGFAAGAVMFRFFL